jgi:hypothetical protein
MFGSLRAFVIDRSGYHKMYIIYILCPTILIVAAQRAGMTAAMNFPATTDEEVDQAEFAA